MKNSDKNIQLIASLENNVGYITLNRLSHHNALTRNMWEQLPIVVEQLIAQGAKVLVFTGNGSAFAAGADLSELEQLKDYAGAKQHWTAIKDCLDYLANVELPSIAMINGACLGGGCLLALACDLRYASHSATFSIPITRLGIILDDNNIHRLSQMIGITASYELLFLGDTISSDKAYALGLINQVVDNQYLKQLVNSVTRQILQNDLNSIKQVKLSLKRLFDNSLMPKDESLVVQSFLDRINKT